MSTHMSPYQRHAEAKHIEAGKTSYVSPDGHSRFEECSACQLCWLLPDVLNGNKYLITILRYPLQGGSK